MKLWKPLSLLLALCLGWSSLFPLPDDAPASALTLEDLGGYEGQLAVVLNDDRPDFPDGDKTSTPFERYSQLDYLGRCGPAYANVGPETMPDQERGPIGMVRPSGWHTVRYDFVDGKYLYNRCHLIGYQLTGENANELNLITGTRYLNVQGMLPYENRVGDYVRETGNHVLYRVTPIYDGSDLVARGVEMEALSVEDEGEGICFHVFVYNVQPGVEIDYATGESRAEGSADPEAAVTPPSVPVPTPVPSPAAETEEAPSPEETVGSEGEVRYVLNTNSHRFHLPTCAGARNIREHNRQEYSGTRQELIEAGYVPCGSCKP